MEDLRQEIKLVRIMSVSAVLDVKDYNPQMLILIAECLLFSINS